MRFIIKYDKTQWIITNNVSKAFRIPDSDNCKYITLTKSINRVRHTILASFFDFTRKIYTTQIDIL